MTIDDKTQSETNVNEFREELGLSKIIKKGRRCLKCKKDFNSLGSHNRICSKCKRNLVAHGEITHKHTPQP